MYHENDRILPLLSNIETGVCRGSVETDQLEPRINLLVFGNIGRRGRRRQENVTVAEIDITDTLV